MNKRIENLYNFIIKKTHHKFRRTVNWDLAENFACRKLHPALRSATALSELLHAENPAFIPGSRIAFVRTITNLPEIYTADEKRILNEKYSFSEKGIPFNFTPDYTSVLSIGLGALRKKIADRMITADDEGKIFLSGALMSIDAVTDLVKRYIIEAEKQGFTQCAENLKAVISDPPQTFEQALQLFRILHYTLWCDGAYHMGIGRLDVMLYPYYRKDIDSGIITEDEGFELLEEFFLTFNIDSDFYTGVQQGDNGQSLMVGGCDADGNDVWNDLSEKILLASCELKLIDPKINFRVNRKTPIERIALGSKLTRAGLGFPQYSNDDVVIPALLKWGYSLEDARNYSCAACWEFIIPGAAHEFVNLDAVSMPEVLLDTMKKSQAEDFETFCNEIRSVLRNRAVGLLDKYHNITCNILPYTSILSPIAIEKAQNITQAGKYHNWGIHCSGLAVAADSLSAIEKIVFEEKKLSLAEFFKIIEENFENSPELLKYVRENTHKLGTSNSGKAVAKLCFLIDAWAEAWEGLKNIQGGIVRPGTGSAMYYIWHSENLSATPDGRLKGEPFSANYAPSLDIPLAGPLTAVRDFSAPDMSKVCNGGPLTIELHDSVFTAENAEMKVAAMIADFISKGGHQLQLNTLNSAVLRDAQVHPERYSNLIVRVWGWSGKFIELDKVYQDHIIRRSEMVFE